MTFIVCCVLTAVGLLCLLDACFETDNRSGIWIIYVKLRRKYLRFRYGNSYMCWGSFDGAVAAWHESDSTLQLHEYIGLTLEEYTKIVEGDRFNDRNKGNL